MSLDIPIIIEPAALNALLDEDELAVVDLGNPETYGYFGVTHHLSIG